LGNSKFEIDKIKKKIKINKIDRPDPFKHPHREIERERRERNKNKRVTSMP
jgi:hypothetical protein